MDQNIDERYIYPNLPCGTERIYDYDGNYREGIDEYEYIQKCSEFEEIYGKDMTVIEEINNLRPFCATEIQYIMDKGKQEGVLLFLSKYNWKVHIDSIFKYSTEKFYPYPISLVEYRIFKPLLLINAIQYEDANNIDNRHHDASSICGWIEDILKYSSNEELLESIEHIDDNFDDIYYVKNILEGEYDRRLKCSSFEFVLDVKKEQFFDSFLDFVQKKGMIDEFVKKARPYVQKDDQVKAIKYLPNISKEFKDANKSFTSLTLTVK